MRMKHPLLVSDESAVEQLLSYDSNFSIKEADREYFISKKKRKKGEPASLYRKISTGEDRVRFFSLSNNKGTTKLFPIFKERTENEKDIGRIFLIKD